MRAALQQVKSELIEAHTRLGVLRREAGPAQGSKEGKAFDKAQSALCVVDRNIRNLLYYDSILPASAVACDECDGTLASHDCNCPSEANAADYEPSERELLEMTE